MMHPTASVCRGRTLRVESPFELRMEGRDSPSVVTVAAGLEAQSPAAVAEAEAPNPQTLAAGGGGPSCRLGLDPAAPGTWLN
jgi:hypothetical protein